MFRSSFFPPTFCFTKAASYRVSCIRTRHKTCLLPPLPSASYLTGGLEPSIFKCSYIVFSTKQWKLTPAIGLVKHVNSGKRKRASTTTKAKSSVQNRERTVFHSWWVGRKSTHAAVYSHYILTCCLSLSLLKWGRQQSPW